MTMSEMEDDEIDEEYDFSGSERAPYATLAGAVHVVSLDGDVWTSFPDSNAVNTALRGLIKGAGSALPEELKKAS
jgi:hypothetical protein